MKFSMQDCLRGKSFLTINSVSVKISILFFFICVSIFELSAQVAPVNPPTKFYINGKLTADSADVGDWVNGAGAGSYVFNDDGTTFIANSQNSKLLDDPANSNSDKVFSGSAFNDNPNNWKWTTGSALNKGEINRGMYHLSSNRATPYDKWIFMGGDRYVTTGTSYIDFEFLQKTLTRNTSDDKFTSLGLDGGRTVNDFVLSMEYVNGGVQANVHFYRWEQIGVSRGVPIFQYVDRTQLIIDNPTWAFAATNTATINVPFNGFGINTYAKSMFVEGAVNMSQILNVLNPCLSLSIKTIFIKTKASDATNAALKDFVEPQQVDFQFGTASISYAGGPFCPTGTTTPTIQGISGGTFSSTAGLTIDANTGVITLGTSTPGTYTVPIISTVEEDASSL